MFWFVFGLCVCVRACVCVCVSVVAFLNATVTISLMNKFFLRANMLLARSAQHPGLNCSDPDSTRSPNNVSL